VVRIPTLELETSLTLTACHCVFMSNSKLSLQGICIYSSLRSCYAILTWSH